MTKWVQDIQTMYGRGGQAFSAVSVTVAERFKYRTFVNVTAYRLPLLYMVRLAVKAAVLSAKA